ncbi:MAG: heme peroxidase family protein [Pseudomonadota bacterium]
MSKHSAHGQSVRGLSAETLEALSGHGDPGKFGRMFPGLSPLHVPDDPLFELAAAMVDDPADDSAGDNLSIPSGFTYLSQFVDHDITLDTTPLAQQMADPTATENFRSPALDLDSLYRAGPGLDPQIYGRRNGALVNGSRAYPHNNRFLLGMAAASPGQGVPQRLPNDLPRNRIGRALIGDERNDENLIIAQTHLAFLKFHNAVIDHLDDTRAGLEGNDQFDEARRIVTWHYQWIVLFDMVERLTEPGLVERIRHNGRRFYRFKKTPYMPAEFSAAAYRFGHSMVREVYDFNRVFNRQPGALAPATLNLLFGFTGKSGAIIGDLVDDPGFEPRPGIPGGVLRELPGNWIVDWRRFFQLDTDVLPTPTRKLDARLVPQLSRLPGEMSREAMLAFRNLRRGVQIGLPSGQDVAHRMGFVSLTSEDIATGPDGAAAEANGLHKQTPLWYYILKEAEVVEQGHRLGPVGSTIVAETLLGLVQGDHRSFLRQRSNWQPELPSERPGHFTMADMLRFVDDINPIGEL